MNFKGKTVVVIEGNQRIGASISLEFLKRGSRVIILASKKNNNQFLNKIKGYGPKIKIITLDPKQPSSIKLSISRIKTATKSIDIVINYVTVWSNNQSILHRTDNWTSLFTIDSKSFHTILKFIIPQMIKQGHGNIVNVSDSPIISAIQYLAIRDKITQFTRSLGRELARKNIHVNAVIAGPVETEDYSHIKKTHGAELSLYFPFRRPAKINEIIEPILFLSSAKASYIYAQTIRVDGGFGA
jgi:3-oxoacyl-[acyl-carrier protein] reductase